MALGFLGVYLQTQYRNKTGRIRHWGTTPPGGEPRIYIMDFPTAGGLRNFPIEGYWGWVATPTVIQVYFLHRNVRDTVIILE